MENIRTLKDLQNLVSGWDKNEAVAAYLNPDGIDASEEPYEDYLRDLMSDPNAIEELLSSGNKAFIKKYEQSKLKDKSIFDQRDMTLDNIAEDLKNISGSDIFYKEDNIGQKKPYTSIDGRTLKAIARVNGWDFPSMLKLIEEAKTKQARKDLWKNEPAYSRFLMSAIAPFSSDKLSNGEVPTNKDYTADAVMAGANLVPFGALGRAAGLVSVAGHSLPGYGLRAVRYGSEFAGPGMAEGLLSLYTGDSKDKREAFLRGLSATGGNAATGATIAGGSTFLKSWASKDAKGAMKTIEDAIKESIYPEEIKSKLRTIKAGLKESGNVSASDLEFLRNVEAFQDLKKGDKKFKLGNISVFSQAKKDDYLKKLKENPTINEHRKAERAKNDEYDKIIFDRYPGILTFTDNIEGNKNINKVGFGKNAGLGPIKTGGGVSPGHQVISSEGRAPLSDWVKVRDEQIRYKQVPDNQDPSKNTLVPHTDPFYPGPDRSSTDLDKYVKEYIEAHPEVKMYIDDDLLSNLKRYYGDLKTKRFLPQVYRHGKSGLTDADFKVDDDDDTK